MTTETAYLIFISLIVCSSYCFYLGYIMGKAVGITETNTARDKQTINILHGRIDE